MRAASLSYWFIFAVSQACDLPADHAQGGASLTEYLHCLSQGCEDADPMLFDGSGEIGCVQAMQRLSCTEQFPGSGFAMGDACPKECDRHCTGEVCRDGFTRVNGECRENQCACNGGTAALGPDCPVDGQALCVQCSPGHNLVDGACEVSQCTCTDGTAATGVDCPANGSSKCVSCDDGYTLVSDSCQANQCTCADGTAATGTDCPANGEAKCGSCSSGFLLVGFECQEKLCTCDHGTGATGNDCPEAGASQCSSCATGYNLVDNSCEENQCTCANGTAATGTDCRTTGEPKCASCSAGYVLAGDSRDSCTRCKSDTGGTCRWLNCFGWRHGATCDLDTYKCVCPPGNCSVGGACRALADCPKVTSISCLLGTCSVGHCHGSAPSRYCTCDLDQCALEDSCTNHSSISLAADVSPMQSMEGEKVFGRYILGAIFFLASFSAMVFATRLFYRGGHDGFVLMNDVEQ